MSTWRSTSSEEKIFRVEALFGILRAWILYGLIYGTWKLGLENHWVEIVFWWIAVVIAGLYTMTFLVCEAIILVKGQQR